MSDADMKHGEVSREKDQDRSDDEQEVDGHRSAAEEQDRSNACEDSQDQEQDQDQDGASRAQLTALFEAARSWSLAEALEQNPHITAQDVADLRQWCEEHSVIPQATDLELVAFLHSCLGDMDRLHKAVTVYHTIRSGTPEVFSDRPYHKEEIQKARTVGYCCILPKKTPEGYRLILQGLRDPDPNNFVAVSGAKVQYLTMDACIRADPTAQGYIFLNDMQGVTMTHMWKQGFRLPRKMMQYVQEGNPLRMMGVHFLNTTPMMDKVMRMMRPLIRKEAMSFLHFHTASDMENFFKVIPRDCMPENYGGSLPSVEKLQANSDYFLERMEDLAPY